MSYRMVHGFGDAQADYQVALQAYKSAVHARETALAQKVAQDAAYDNAMRSYSMTKSQIDAAFSAAMPGYNAAMAAWQSKNAAYQSALSSRSSQAAAQSAQTASVVRSTGVQPPSGYSGCLTATDQASYASICSSSTVRGVDGLGWARVPGLPSLFGLGATSTPQCAWAKLPVCQPLPPLPPAPGPKPTPPMKQPYPPAPVKPTAVYVPPDPGSPPTPPAVTASAAPPPKALAVGGILAIVLVGGGAAYYLTTRKKKAA